ncbi:MAG: thioredoxin-disulfide reductase [Candidatus Cloacimonetes bacterium HGW-Cloacimonetes-1]|nr:MAG: thioredoxin-disulfide reductase [Candidatus Cloacimonetes bacterium HGW-Cloacimonetes-1]
MPTNADPNTLYDLIIIGGGPAGLTAGLYAARYKLKTLMLEKAVISGGQLTATEWVENYPGFPEPILGQKLAKDMESQAKQFGLEIINESVIDVDLAGSIKKIVTDYSTWQAKSVLIATGSASRKLGVPGEKENAGRGVSYCATCDGPFYPDKIVAVIGGGNSAFEESIFLAKYASKVVIIHRSDDYRADKIIQDKVMANPKIELMPGYAVQSIEFANSDDKHLVLVEQGTGAEISFPADGVFIFIGHVPNTKLFEEKIELEAGYIVTDRRHFTNVEGVWAAGDVEAKSLRQVATAVGDGACAAFWINKYIEDWTEN